jgi:predicted Zn-dependent protease
VSAAKLGDLAAADAARERLAAARQKAGSAYAAKEVGILEKEVAAIVSLARGQTDDAIRLAKEAADLELTTAPPSGPPDPVKPALELYGEILLEADRPADAAAAFQQSLLRTPKRTPSLLGLARAAAKTGDVAAARRQYAELAAMPGAAPGSPAVIEARKFLKEQTTDGVR